MEQENGMKQIINSIPYNWNGIHSITFHIKMEMDLENGMEWNETKLYGNFVLVGKYY